MSQFLYKGRRPRDSALEELLSTPPGLMAVDTETVSLKDRSLLGVGLYNPAEDEGLYVMEDSPLLYPVIEMLQSPDVCKVMHNALYDLSVLGPMPNVQDTSIMAGLLGYERGLKELAWQLLDMEIREIKDVLPKGQDMRSLPVELVGEKCLDDTEATYHCYLAMIGKVDLGYFSREMQVLEILAKMSSQGVLIDQERRAEIELEYSKKLAHYEALAQQEGFNPSSPQQVGYMLGSRGNFLPTKRNVDKTGKVKWSVCTDEDTLLKVEDTMAKVVLEYRDVKYFLSHFVIPMAAAERMSCRYHMYAATGRVASTDRNLQNIPKGLARSMFLPDNGLFTDFDFSQQELRTLAYVSGDPVMQDIYARDGDIHQETADFMEIKRSVAKSVTFAMIYGGEAETIMETAGLTDLSLAERLRESWFRKYAGAAGWMQDVQEQGLKDGYVVTIQGRRLKLPVGTEEEAGLRRKSVNYVIQGSAAEITKDAMVRCKDLPLKMQVHDELVSDGFTSEEEITERLTGVAPFECPVSIDWLERWK